MHLLLGEGFGGSFTWLVGLRDCSYITWSTITTYSSCFLLHLLLFVVDTRCFFGPFSVQPPGWHRPPHYPGILSLLWLCTDHNVATVQGDPLSSIKYVADCMFPCKMHGNPKAVQCVHIVFCRSQMFTDFFSVRSHGPLLVSDPVSQTQSSRFIQRGLHTEMRGQHGANSLPEMIKLALPFFFTLPICTALGYGSLNSYSR